MGPQQQKVYDLLKEGKRPTEIARTLGVSKAAITKALIKLERDGLITRPGDGSIVIIDVSGEPVDGQGVSPRPVAGLTRKPPPPRSEFGEFWRDVLTTEERRLLEAAEQPAPRELARQQVSLCDILIRRIAERVRKLEDMPLDLIVESETNLVRHSSKGAARDDDDDGDRPPAMPSMSITRSTTVREAIMGLYKAQREFLKVRAASIQVLHVIERAPQAKAAQPGAGADQFTEDLSGLSDEELAQRIRDLGTGLGGGDGGSTPTH